MKFKIRDITSSGLAFEEQLQPAELDIGEDFIDISRPVVVKGVLTKVDDFIFAKLHVTYALAMACARCLCKVHSESAADYDLEFDFDPRSEYVDIGRAVREELLMAYQPRILCREDCKGFCAGCGAELNNEKCTCEEDKQIKGSH